ncbi:hypothetical protein [Shewanella surugensis]|uniref:Uncharacterized protein n=1 Tax=Shewanella surugensis TaxID=212020 RepID=A0ABT0L6L1_9GAMM|nr:hypothetical protein [Shewanella surugensis]MCL1123331.1 hypothetical protein [Shewanella surugensis]
MTKSTPQSVSISDALLQQANQLIKTFNTDKNQLSELVIENTLETLHATADTLELPVANHLLSRMVEFRDLFELTPINAKVA